MSSRSVSQPKRQIVFAIIVAALGYFVDIYDLLLFGIIRQPSLASLGLSDSQILTEGEFLVSAQMMGLLLGGIFWGILGDKKGRLSVLFGSILTYSIANIANAFVDDVNSYALLRFIAGLGLAGELGAGVTLVSELMSKETRGYGTTLIATFGILGAVAAGFVARTHWGFANFEDWRMAYIIGGGLGLVLLGLRFSVYESGLFSQMKADKNLKKGDFLMLLKSRDRFKRYVQAIFVGAPIWFVVGILVFFVGEFSAEVGLSAAVQKTLKAETGWVIMMTYIGLSIGDFSSGMLSQILRSRKRAILIFMTGTLLISVYYLLFMEGVSAMHVYVVCFMLGFSTGYWAVFVTNAAEQFGTNIRATVTTTVPNFVRGLLSLWILMYAFLRGDATPDGGYDGLGMIPATLIVGGLVYVLAYIALFTMQETYGKDLHYYEE